MSGEILLHNADMRAIMPTIEARSIDLVLADPPYGETSLKWDRWPSGWPALMKRVIKLSGSMWVFGSLRMLLENAAEFDGWQLVQDVVWEKQNGSGLHNDRFRRVHEIACQFRLADVPWAQVYKCPQYTNDARARKIRRSQKPAHWGGIENGEMYRSQDGGPRLMRSVMYAANLHGHADHPTQKPIEIVEPLLLYSCPENGLVLDPFAGSGTTGIVSRRHSRRAVLIEADQEYYRTCHRRLADDAPLFQGRTV